MQECKVVQKFYTAKQNIYKVLLLFFTVLMPFSWLKLTLVSSLRRYFPLVWNCIAVADNDTERQIRGSSFLISAVKKSLANRIVMLYPKINIIKVIHKITLKQ